MPNPGGEKASRKKKFLESGKPSHYLDLGEETPIIDAVTELDKIESALRGTHEEKVKDQEKIRKTWVDRRDGKSKKNFGNKDLNF